MRGFIFTTIIVALLLTNVTIVAQQSQTPDRDRVIAELKPYKHKFFTKELSLSKEQASEFLPLYDSMDAAVQAISEETRELERQIIAKTEASDTEKEAVARAIFEEKVKEGNIELEYFEKFRAILSPEQLLRLKSVERQFNQRLIRHHRKLTRDRQDTNNCPTNAEERQEGGEH